MKRNIIHSIVICLAALVLPVMVACSSQNEPLPEVDGHYLAVFTLDLSDAGYGTARAAAADGENSPAVGEYAPGSGLENFIDFYQKNYRCYLFGKDNRLISNLPAVLIQETADNIFKIRLRLDETEQVKNALTNGCRFVFLANWGLYPEPVAGVTTIAELCADPNAIFGFSQEKTQLSSDNLIPMYGVKEFENGVQDFIDGKVISNIGTIHLLRAYAKIEVNLSFEDFVEAPGDVSVSLTHSNNKGYKAPANVTKEGDYYTGLWQKDYTPVNIPDGADDIPLTLTKDDDGHYIAYVPEYKNVDADKKPLDSRSQIKVSFTIGNVDAGGLKVEREFDFCYSDNPPAGVIAGEHFDIARNNWYKFNITAKGKDIVWTVTVIPFTGVEVAPEYGLEREKFTGYIIGKDKDGKQCWYDGNYYDPDKAVPLYLGPTGHEGEFVTINGKKYLLVYSDYGRTAANLDHFFEEETRKKYLLYPAGRTGYKIMTDAYGSDVYVNDSKQLVWLDEDYNEWEVKWNPDRVNSDNTKGRYEWVYTPGKWYRTLNEWDRLDWNRAVWDKEVADPRIYPRFWFDIFGNRYPWSEGDTKEKRAAILGEWTSYLEESETY